MLNRFKFITVLSFSISVSANASTLTLSSHDITQGKFMDKAQEFDGFCCTGENLSPHLKWSNVPKGTKSFANTAYELNTPTGSGWWHWQIVNIPKKITEIPTGAGDINQEMAPLGSKQIDNDYGMKAFGDAYPPSGLRVHHYRFTIHALTVENLDLPTNASGALTGYMIKANTIESLYKRD